MPIFEYMCRKCNKKFEKLTFDKNEKIACPHCSGTDTEKQLSTFSSTSGGKKAGPSCPNGGCCPGCH